MTAEIIRSVAEKAVCWCDGRRIRSSRAQKLGPAWLALWAAGGGIRLRFYTLQPRLPAALLCNCWNSIAVMFELRCSEFELGCSESADQPAGSGAQGVGGSNPLSPTNVSKQIRLFGLKFTINCGCFCDSSRLRHSQSRNLIAFWCRFSQWRRKGIRVELLIVKMLVVLCGPTSMASAKSIISSH